MTTPTTDHEKTLAFAKACGIEIFQDGGAGIFWKREPDPILGKVRFRPDCDANDALEGLRAFCDQRDKMAVLRLLPGGSECIISARGKTEHSVLHSGSNTECRAIVEAVLAASAGEKG